MLPRQVRRWLLLGLLLAAFWSIKTITRTFHLGSDTATHAAAPNHGRSLLSLDWMRGEGDSSSQSTAQTCNTAFDHSGGVVVYLVVILYSILGLAYVCEHNFKEALLVIAAKLHLSDDVAGATFMAAGTSSPELFTSLFGVFSPGTDDVGAGTIVGSAIFNIAIIIGASSIVTPEVVHIHWKPVIRDCVVNVLTFIFLLGAFADGQILWYEASIAILMYVAYIVMMAFNDRVMWFVESFIRRTINGFIRLGHRCGGTREQIRQTPWTLPAAEVDDESGGGLLLRDWDDGGDSHGPPMQLLSSSDDALSAGDAGSIIATPSSSIVLNDDADAGGVVDAAMMGEEDEEPMTLNPALDGGSLDSAGDSSLMLEDADGDDLNLDEDDTAWDALTYEAPHSGAHFRQVTSIGSWPIYLSASKPMDWSDLPSGRAMRFLAIIGSPFKYLFHWGIPNAENPTTRAAPILCFIMSLAFIGILTTVLTTMTTKVGCIFDIDDSVTGTTLLAIGTSMPDALTSIFVARSGKADMAVCNALGSNVFDVLFALGLPWLCGIMVGDEILVSAGDVEVYTLMLFVVMGALIISLTATRWRLNRKVGAVLFISYALFAIYSVLHEVHGVPI